MGNIPYDVAETQLTSVMEEVGTVVSFRLVFDRETGKPKGYGFCTYQDHETAASAVRNLNNVELGGRPLKVDYADAAEEDVTDTLMSRDQLIHLIDPLDHPQPLQ